MQQRIIWILGSVIKILGNWSEAEIWYDIYLEKENASSDEIIRYSEILAKNNHISKGEPILKSYTEKFSDDHRLWSRYGYFVLWLGKNKIAIDAFTKALEIRPYFKEALDGLDLARGKGYVYSINDTTTRFNYGISSTATEYAIDKYHRMLKNNKSDDETRYKLIDELIIANRYEEAFEQLKILSLNHSEATRFKDLWVKVTTLRKSFYADRINFYEDQLSKDPTNKKVLLDLAKYYSYNNDYDLATNLYKSYLLNNPNDNEVKFNLAQVLMWQNNLCEAADISNNLAQSSPEKIEYLLFAAKINFWLEKDFIYTQSLYEKVLIKEPQNTEAMFGLANLYIRNKNITSAEKLLREISFIDSTSNNFYVLKNNFISAKNQKKIDELNLVLDEARNFSARRDYYYSIKFFNKYLASDPGNKQVKLELADVYLASSDFNSAINIYDDVLKFESDYAIEKQRAKVHLWRSDSLVALKEFMQLNKKNPNDIETKLYLGDAYLQSGQLQNARTIYEELLTKSPDSHILKTRLGWLGGTGKFSFDRFPTYIQLIPRAMYFTDNTDFIYSNFGLGFDFGITRFLAFGLSGSRGKLSSESEDLRFSQIKGTAYLKFNDIFSGSAGFGTTFFANSLKENIIEFSLSAQKKNLFNVTAFLNYSDAAFILYSPFLVNSRLNAYHFGLNAEYRFKNNLILSGKYFYIDVSDNKTGNQFQARVGKVFESDITAGYEYFFYTFDTQSILYWSPKNFESHSVWSDWTLYKDDEVDFTIGGKLGLIPQNDYILSEFYAAFNYQIINSIFLQLRYTTGSSFRSNFGYRSNSIQASFIWNL